MASPAPSLACRVRLPAIAGHGRTASAAPPSPASSPSCAGLPRSPFASSRQASASTASPSTPAAPATPAAAPPLPPPPTASPTAAAAAAASTPRRRPLARPAAFSSGEFTAAPTFLPADGALEAGSPTYRGLPPPALEPAFRQRHPGLLEALAAASAGMTPATAAQLLRRLEAELPPALHERAPGGDSMLVAVGRLAPLLHRAATCCEAALAGGRPRCAAATARAALSLLSHLSFSGGQAAAPYAQAAVRCKQALKAAYDAGAEVRQEDVVDLYAACARASPWLWLTPYAGHRFACAVDDMVTAGWATAELAVRFTEAYAALLGAGRLLPCERRYVRLVQAALRHPSLSLGQARCLLDATDARLPVDFRISLALMARSQPTADVHAQLLAALAALERAARAPQRAPARRQPKPAPAREAGRRLAPARALRARQQV